MSLAIIFSFIIVVVFLIFSLTYYLYYYSLYNGCQNYANFWCWTDWICPNETDPTKQFPAQTVYNCKPGTTRDRNFCSKPENKDTLGCRCNLAITGGQLPAECTCEWGNSGDAPLDQCGNLFCSGGNVNQCNN